MVMPSPHFNPNDCLDAIETEKCTSIYGTPTMFTDMIAAQRIKKRQIDSVETGIMAGNSQFLGRGVTTTVTSKFPRIRKLVEVSQIFEPSANPEKQLKTFENVDLCTKITFIFDSAVLRK